MPTPPAVTSSIRPSLLSPALSSREATAGKWPFAGIPTFPDFGCIEIALCQGGEDAEALERRHSPVGRSRAGSWRLRLGEHQAPTALLQLPSFTR